MVLVLALGLSVATGAGSAEEGIPRHRVADMLYELAFASRKVYTRDIVQRLSVEESVITASEHYREEKGLPLPAQMFRYSAEELLQNTDDYWLSLRALTPINLASGPLTAVEEKGLQRVMDNPGEPFYAEEEVFGKQSLVAVYAGRGERRGLRRMPQQPPRVAPARLQARRRDGRGHHPSLHVRSAALERRTPERG